MRKLSSMVGALALSACSYAEQDLMVFSDGIDGHFMYSDRYDFRGKPLPSAIPSDVRVSITLEANREPFPLPGYPAGVLYDALLSAPEPSTCNLIYTVRKDPFWTNLLLEPDANYFLAFRVDSTSRMREYDEENNLARAPLTIDDLMRCSPNL